MDYDVLKDLGICMTDLQDNLHAASTAYQDAKTPEQKTEAAKQLVLLSKSIANVEGAYTEATTPAETALPWYARIDWTKIAVCTIAGGFAIGQGVLMYNMQQNGFLTKDVTKLQTPRLM